MRFLVKFQHFAHLVREAKRSTHAYILIFAILPFVSFVSVKMLRAGQTTTDPKNSAAGSHGVDLTILDKTCKPCEDFFNYANGEWLKKNPVPAAYPTWGRFNELAERNREQLHGILESAAGNSKALSGSNEQKIGDFYASCMDEKQINAASAKPLDAEFSRIGAVSNAVDLQGEVTRLQSMGVGALFEFGSTQDMKDSTRVIGAAEQGGLGLPDRDYYTKADDKSKQIREQYQDHIAKMLALVGDDATKAAAEAKTILDLEIKLAEASLTNVERRDPAKTYHKMSRPELQKLTPNWSWDTYFQEIGYTNIDSVDVSAPKFFETMSRELKEIPVDNWKIYLRWHLVNAAAPWLSQPLVD